MLETSKHREMHRLLYRSGATSLPRNALTFCRAHNERSELHDANFRVVGGAITSIPRHERKLVNFTRRTRVSRLIQPAGLARFDTNTFGPLCAFTCTRGTHSHKNNREAILRRDGSTALTTFRASLTEMRLAGCST